MLNPLAVVHVPSDLVCQAEQVLLATATDHDHNRSALNNRTTSPNRKSLTCKGVVRVEMRSESCMVSISKVKGLVMDINMH